MGGKEELEHMERREMSVAYVYILRRVLARARSGLRSPGPWFPGYRLVVSDLRAASREETVCCGWRRFQLGLHLTGVSHGMLDFL